MDTQEDKNLKRTIDESIATDKAPVVEDTIADDDVIATTSTTTTTTTDNNEGENDPNKRQKTSDKTKLVIFNLPKYMNTKQLKKLLDTQNVAYSTCKMVPKDRFGVIGVETEKKDEVMSKLNGLEVKGDTLKVMIKSDGGNNSGSGAKKNNNSNGNGNKTQEETKLKVIEDVVNPWHSVDYSEQLERKKQYVTKVLTDIIPAIKKECGHNNNAKFPDWLRAAKKSTPCCPLEEVVASPVIDGYRNKCSYTIGVLADGTPCVGFSLGRTGDGVTVVGDPSNCRIISKRSNAIRSHLETFVRASPLKPYEKTTHMGFWRQLTIRDFTTGETMATIQVSPQGLSKEVVQETIDAVTKHFSDLPQDSPAHVTSFQVQYYDGVSNAAPVDHPVTTVFGPDHIHEKLLGFQFQVSSNAFFQVNSAATEKLYSKVLEWANCSKDTILLDVCCGTGTIGQCVSNNVRHIYGLELAPDAVKDAQANATLNNIKNVDYIVGKAEDTMKGLVNRIKSTFGSSYKDGDIIGIVDPPRSGLHLDVIKALRSFEPMKRLVYVSCNQNSLITDATKLSKIITNNMGGTPFRPVKAIAFDLFPHTELVEVVVLFERVDYKTQEQQTTIKNAAISSTETEPTKTNTNNESEKEQPAITPASTIAQVPSITTLNWAEETDREEAEKSLAAEKKNHQ